PYECDGLTAYRQVPMVVALPETEEQVQRVLQTCTAMGVPVVPRGAGTGLSGGALPPGNGVLLSMAKFMRIVRVDSRARIVAVKLLPKPQCARVIMASFDDVGKAGQAVADIIAAGIIPAGLEMMDQPATRAVEQFVGAGYDLEAAAILLCESDGTPEEVEDEIVRMQAVLERSGVARMTVSRDEAERLRFWSGRKAAFPAVGRISPDYYCMDGTIPRKR